MNFFLSSRWSVRLALIIIALLALIALTSQWWLPYDPQAIDLPSRLLSPDAQHWLGTDHLGRDIFSRLMAATRVSLGSVMACLLLVLTLGLVIGGSAGLIGGRVDQATMRVADMFMTFPTSILSFFMVGVLGTGLTNVIIAIALSHWAWYARMVRSLVISLRQREFVRRYGFLARAMRRVFVDHLAGAAIPFAAGAGNAGYRPYDAARRGRLSFGLGVTAPTAEWGVMINDARQYIWTQPLQMFWPGLALFISVMAFNLVGDALRGSSWHLSGDEARTLMPQQIELRNIALQAAQPLVHGVSLTLQRGRVLALVGGSGSGKSLTCAATLGILPAGVRQTAGEILADGKPVSPCALRGIKIATIMQNPPASLIHCTPCTPTRGKPAWR